MHIKSDSRSKSGDWKSSNELCWKPRTGENSSFASTKSDKGYSWTMKNVASVSLRTFEKGFMRKSVKTSRKRLNKCCVSDLSWLRPVPFLRSRNCISKESRQYYRLKRHRL